jgi:hypothetical protein
VLTWSQHLLSFYRNLRPPTALPNGIEWLYPQQDPQVMKVVESFLQKYYDDTRPRQLMFGINPGRHGAGITGVNFTAARQLTHVCGIDHPFKSGTELSAEFIYDMIGAYGGASGFYSRFFISSVCPLGFVQNGRNLNYYDDKAVLETVTHFIINSIGQLLDHRVDRSVVYCIGGEKNFKYFSGWNEANGWFDTVIPLAHPRYIMQYRRKEKEQFIREYLRLMA